jgi:hypothetical protein
MKYALVIFEADQDFAKREGAESQQYWAGWMAYTQVIREAGVMVGGAGLQPPSTATTIRHLNGSIQVQDGPFADSKEQLGGFYLIDVPNLDQAIEWAARVPISELGRVEIRPMLPPPPDQG